ncbi:hypothetical protein [uncultured Methanospirillum sp.]|uniref:hypothetical protein n=1 Tax=uncultured Methanospirillum sp. TaxID=262503 RepID=UPI0029C83D4F|nr:hypothetical protein [uncultured Methanospirillum sp.]
MRTMIYPFRLLGITCLLTLIIGCILVAGVVYADSYDPFHPPLNPDEYPLPASFTAIGSSTSFTSSPSTSSSQDPVVLTETRASLQKNQSAVQMITFSNAGTLKAVCLSGAGFELYSLKNDKFPENSTFRSDYGKSSMVTATSPVTLDITVGTWYFTIFPIGEGCSYDITAVQKGSSGSSSGSGSSFSSSMGVSSFSLG